MLHLACSEDFFYIELHVKIIPKSRDTKRIDETTTFFFPFHGSRTDR
jgi:hypothetical protein